MHEPLPSKQFAAFGIAEGPVSGGLKRLFMSHPPLDERIAALRALDILIDRRAPRRRTCAEQLRGILGGDGHGRIGGRSERPT